MKWTTVVKASMFGLALGSEEAKREIQQNARELSFQNRAAADIGIALAEAKRALPNSPSGGYAPEKVDCPSTRPTARDATGLSSEEVAWLELRRNNTITPMTTLLERANISDFDATSYIQSVQNNASTLPNIAIAMSGGGYRALLNGAGFLAAADDRTGNASGAGDLGGLLQSATYLAGLSGGGWLVSSIYMNNFSTITNLRDGSPGSDVWQFQNSIFDGPEEEGISILNSAEYYYNIYDDVNDKDDAGFDISITDYWGRALSFQLINDTDGGVAYTFSSIALSDNFINGSIPLPILVVDEREPGTTIVSLNATNYEFNPWEMGSWDPTLYGFVPMEYVGTNFTDGSVPSSDKCVRGFDQAGYVLGTSSTLFNQFLLYTNSTGLPDFVVTALDDILEDIGEDNNDIAQWYPNPFYKYHSSFNGNANKTQLTLVDGGEDLQNIPLNPLIQPYREVDVIFAVDSSADNTYNWPNGTALVATYERNLNSSIMNGTSFPAIPDQNTFINLGLNTQPTFFGCNVSNTSSFTPLVVYVPNAPYVTQSNVSTFDPSYNETQRNLIIENGYDVATMGNGTMDSQWPTCVACAILSRSFYKTGTDIPADCTTCFNRYCWNGTTNSTTPSEPYAPGYKLSEIEMSDATSLGHSRMALLAVGVTAGFFLM